MRHIGDLGPAQAAYAAQANVQDVPPVDPDLAAGDLDAATAIGHRGQTDGRFAGAGFPDQPQDFARLQIEGHAMHDFDVMRAFTGRVDGGANLQIADFQKRFTHPRPPFSEVVRFSTQSATRLTEMASVAMAMAGTSAAGMP